MEVDPAASPLLPGFSPALPGLSPASSGALPVQSDRVPPKSRGRKPRAVQNLLSRGGRVCRSESRCATKIQHRARASRARTNPVRATTRERTRRHFARALTAHAAKLLGAAGADDDEAWSADCGAGCLGHPRDCSAHQLRDSPAQAVGKNVLVTTGIDATSLERAAFPPRDMDNTLGVKVEDRTGVHPAPGRPCSRTDGAPVLDMVVGSWKPVKQESGQGTEAPPSSMKLASPSPH